MTILWERHSLRMQLKATGFGYLRDCRSRCRLKESLLRGEMQTDETLRCWTHGPAGLRIVALHDSWEHLASMEEKVYLEFEAEIQGEQTHFLIEVDKESEDPELRAEDFIHLQHFAEITNTKGPRLVDAAYAATLYKIKLIATHRDGKVWIVQKP